MAYDDFTLGPFTANDEGKILQITQQVVVGEIIKVSVKYGKGENDPGALMTLKLFTSDGEEIIKLHEHNTDGVWYPRHSLVEEKVFQIPLDGQNIVERFVSMGQIMVDAERMKKGGVIEEVKITVKE